MDEKAIPYRKIVFVCTNERAPGERVSCGGCGGGEIHARLKELVKERGLRVEVRVSKSGCMDRCELGPNVMIFPDNIWLSGVRLEDIEQVVALLEVN